MYSEKVKCYGSRSQTDVSEGNKNARTPYIIRQNIQTCDFISLRVFAILKNLEF